MIIEKKGKSYNISEQKDKWIVKFENGKLSISYDVSKTICSTEEELKEYILQNNLF